jgi:hypothetical protein
VEKGNMQGVPTLSADDLMKYYDRMRGKVEHEDNLVNHRMMWMITLHGFLYASYGLAISPAIEKFFRNDSDLSIDLSWDQLQYLSDLKSIIALVGIISGIAAFIGIVAAFRAIRRDDYFLSVVRRDCIEPVHVPTLIGHGASNVLGMLCGLLIPFLSIGAWVLLEGPNVIDVVRTGLQQSPLLAPALFLIAIVDKNPAQSALWIGGTLAMMALLWVILPERAYALLLLPFKKVWASIASVWSPKGPLPAAGQPVTSLENEKGP